MKRLNLYLTLLGTVFATMSCMEYGEDYGDDIDDPRDPQYVYHQYDVATIAITTENGAEIISKEDYVNCTVTVDGKDKYNDYVGKGRIRGRGNSTWLWYDKKPYRIKLDKKSSILGIPEDKDWVLLATYRDPTFLMNTVAFEMGNYMGMPHTNVSRFAEVTLNGKQIGLYFVTQQVEEGEFRVNVAKEKGYLLGMDLDDGPELSPNAKDNFYSEVYDMPICVKFPDAEEVAGVVEGAKAELAKLENAIKTLNYKSAAQMLDMQSMIDFLIIQEIVENVELCAPRSVYLHRNPQGIWVMGPLWDFDAGFDFDWGSMMTGHNFFADYKELILGTNPYKNTGAYGSGIPRFFLDLFAMPEFVSAFKARWNELKVPMMDEVQEQIATYKDALAPAMARNQKIWPINPTYKTEIGRMSAWLDKRVAYLDGVIKAYPNNPLTGK